MKYSDTGAHRFRLYISSPPLLINKVSLSLLLPKRASAGRRHLRGRQRALHLFFSKEVRTPIMCTPKSLLFIDPTAPSASKTSLTQSPLTIGWLSHQPDFPKPSPAPSHPCSPHTTSRSSSSSSMWCACGVEKSRLGSDAYEAGAPPVACKCVQTIVEVAKWGARAFRAR